MKAEFEEKEFEIQIGAEMKSRYGFIYAPGQVLENTIGIDLALVCPESNFWMMFKNAPSSLFPIERTPSGIRLKNEYWKQLEKTIDRFPKFEFNAFFQHKRPTFLTRGNAPEWHLFGKPYFRYKVTAHQQLAMEKLAAICGDQAVVAYSCPAFSTYEKLWHYTESEELINRTNFVRVSAMTGHKRYVFSEVGVSGTGLSEPEELEHLSLDDEFSRLRSIDRYGESNLQFLFNLSVAVKQASDGTRFSDFIERRAFEAREISEFASAVVRIQYFCAVNHLRWMVAI